MNGPGSTAASLSHIPKRFDYIDTMRGIAVTLVIMSHVKNLFPDMYWKVWTLAEFGAHGVQLFFVASALTLMLSWHVRSDGAAQFYVRRLFRIASTFWLAILVYSLLFAFGLYPDGSREWQDIALTATFLHGLSPTAINLVVPGGWTIGVEMMFYALFPLIAALVTSLPRAIAFAGLSIALGAAANSLLPHLPTDLTGQPLAFFSYYWFPANLQSFACGCLAYHLLGLVPILSVHRGTMLLVAAAGPALSLIAAWAGVPWFSTLTAPCSRAVLASLASVALALTLAAHSPRWLVNPMTRFVGRVSYSAYLLHFLVYVPLLAFIGPVRIGPIPSMAAFAGTLTAVMAATLALSALTYRWIETPGINAGNRLMVRLSGLVGSEAAGGGKQYPTAI